MSELVKTQQRFAQCAAMLIRVAFARGWDVTLGHAWRCDECPTGHIRSNHKTRLAVDLILWRGETLLDGQEAADAYHEMHKAWFDLGGAEAIPGDANHFSFAWQGMR